MCVWILFNLCDVSALIPPDDVSSSPCKSAVHLGICDSVCGGGGVGGSSSPCKSAVLLDVNVCVCGGLSCENTVFLVLNMCVCVPGGGGCHLLITVQYFCM